MWCWQQHIRNVRIELRYTNHIKVWFVGYRVFSRRWWPSFTFHVEKSITRKDELSDHVSRYKIISWSPFTRSIKSQSQFTQFKYPFWPTLYNSTTRNTYMYTFATWNMSNVLNMVALGSVANSTISCTAIPLHTSVFCRFKISKYLYYSIDNCMLT